MDTEAKKLLDHSVSDLLSLETMFFFSDFAGAAIDLAALSSRLGCDAAPVKRALASLTRAGIVECSRLGAGRYELYSYTKDTDLRAAVRRLSKYYHEDPNSQVEIIRHIVAKKVRAGRKARTSGAV